MSANCWNQSNMNNSHLSIGIAVLLNHKPNVCLQTLELKEMNNSHLSIVFINLLTIQINIDGRPDDNRRVSIKSFEQAMRSKACAILSRANSKRSCQFNTPTNLRQFVRIHPKFESGGV